MLKIVGSDLNTDVYRGQLDRCLHISFSVLSFPVWSSKTAHFFPSRCHIGYRVAPVKQTIGFQIDLIICLQQIDPKFRSITV